MNEGHMFWDQLTDFLIWEHCNLLEELSGDTDKGILRPFMEPIYRGTIDKTGEHARADTESITDWGEAETQVKIPSNLVNEVVENWPRCILNSIWFGWGSDFTDDTVNFVFCEKFRNVAGREDIVDVNEEWI